MKPMLAIETVPTVIISLSPEMLGFAVCLRMITKSLVRKGSVLNFVDAVESLCDAHASLSVFDTPCSACVSAMSMPSTSSASCDVAPGLSFVLCPEVAIGEACDSRGC